MSSLTATGLALRPVAANSSPARRYSSARRNTLPRSDRVTAVSGRWSHTEVVRLEVPVETLLWCPGESPSRDDVELATAVAELADTAYQISERTLNRIHPGLRTPTLLSVLPVPRHGPTSVLRDARLVLVADGIEYAGNLGTLIRTADACGADGVVLTSMDARVTHPKVFVASRGTVLTMPVLEYADVSAARRDLREAGFRIYVADPAAETSYLETDFTARSAVVVGSEGEGVAPSWREGDTTSMSIPMRGYADSLNVAASAAILLFAAANSTHAAQAERGS